MVIFQSRDKHLLESLSRYGVMSTKQISDRFFSGVAHTAVMRRLRLLEENRIIQRAEGLPNNMSAWSLTTLGARVFGFENPFRYTNRNTLLHEVTLTQVRLSLEKMGLANDWVSEYQIKRERGKIYGNGRNEYLVPDGIFTFAQNKTTRVVAVELELHPKNHLRYRKLFQDYACKDSLDYVWYIVSQPSIGET